MPPAEPGIHATSPPRSTGGNIDCKELVAEATFLALDAMLELLGEQYGMGRAEALAMAGIVVDLRVTQVANGVKGVHAVLPHGAIS